MLHNWIKQSTHGFAGKKIIQECVSDKIVIGKPNKKVSLTKRINHLQEWFSSLAKIPSHYCRKQPNRLYLEGPFLHKSKVFEVYKYKCVEDNILPLSYCYFYKFMKEKKFSIFMPRKDKCDYCSSYDMGHIDDDDFVVHIAHKNRAREEMKKYTLLAKENQCY